MKRKWEDEGGRETNDFGQGTTQWGRHHMDKVRLFQAPFWVTTLTTKQSWPCRPLHAWRPRYPGEGYMGYRPKLDRYNRERGV